MAAFIRVFEKKTARTVPRTTNLTYFDEVKLGDKAKEASKDRATLATEAGGQKCAQKALRRKSRASTQIGLALKGEQIGFSVCSTLLQIWEPLKPRRETTLDIAVTQGTCPCSSSPAAAATAPIMERDKALPTTLLV